MLADLLQILRRIWPISVIATLMGVASGVATAALLGLTNRALRDGSLALPSLIEAFAGLCLLALAGEIVSDIGNSYVGQRVIASLRTEICRKILAAPIQVIEEYKSHRLIAVLNQDIDTISAFSFLFSSLAIAIATVLACVGYLFILSPSMSLIAVAAIALGTVAQSLARRVGIRRFGSARKAEDQLQKHFRSITDGAKELRLNRAYRQHMQSVELSGTIASILQLRVRASNVFVSANAFGSLLYFVVVGIVLVMLSHAPDANRHVLSGFVLVLLYMKGPIQEIVGALPSIGRAQVAMRSIAALVEKFSHREPSLFDDAVTPAEAPASFDVITLRDVGYRFASPEADPTNDTAHRATRGFELGPLTLDIKRGETLFIVGENGSGKTTLIKLLLGLYAPTDGQIEVDGKPIGVESLDAYRQMFSTVFSDYHLFDTIFGAKGDTDHRATQYLDYLGIANKVDIVNGKFSTTDLSTGQRKRLALVHAYLENRPVIVLDEWAADQDPTFRRAFYTTILADLKRQGKTLVVISHDDRYFDVADRVVRIDEGKIVDGMPLEGIKAAANQ